MQLKKDMKCPCTMSNVSYSANRKLEFMWVQWIQSMLSFHVRTTINTFTEAPIHFSTVHLYA